MAIPTFVAAGTPDAGVGAVTPGLPAGHTTDDILVLGVDSNSSQPAAAPTGYTQFPDSPQDVGGLGSACLSVFWKRDNGSESAPTVADTGNHTNAVIIAIRGCVTTGDPFDVTAGDVTAGGAGSTVVTIPGDTTTVADCLIVALATHSTDTTVAEFSNWTNLSLSDVTERVDASTDAGGGGGIGIATGGKATAGAYGNTVATLATSSEQGRMSIALKPAADGVTTISAVGAIASAEEFGAPRVIRALANAGAVASLESVGAPRAYRLLTGAGGVGSAEAHGDPRIVRVLAQAGAVASAEAFGEPAVSIVVVSEADISAAGGIASAEAFGVAQLIRRLANSGGIGSGEAFGASRLIRPLGTAGISSAEAHGAPRLLRLLAASGIASEETVGAPRVLRVVFAHSITTGETFGTATVSEFEPPAPGTEPAFGKVFLSDAPRYQVIVSDGETWLVSIRDIPIGDVLIEDQLRG